jgi:predicted small lipoprotein YifL
MLYAVTIRSPVPDPPELLLRDFRMSLAALAVASGLLAGCGLKGPLELPERPSNMVIRPAPGSPPADATEAPAPGTPSPAPATPPAEEPEEPLPPPGLPRGQRGGPS